MSLLDRVAIHGGDVGVAAKTAGPFLANGVALSMVNGATIDAGRDLLADSLLLSNQSHAGDLETNHLTTQNNPTWGGVFAYVPSAMPALPLPGSASAGASDLTLPNDGTATISPGALRAVSLHDRAVLRLNAGAYDFASLTMTNDAKLYALGAVQVRVAGRLSAGDRAYLQPSGAGLTAADLRLEVDGVNGGSGPGGNPSALKLGNDDVVTALVLVANGTLRAGQRNMVNGALFGRDVLVNSDSVVTFQGGFAGTSCPASCDDGNPCTADACTNGACTHVPAPNGTACSDGSACTQTDTCQAGTCTGSNPVACQASDVCHVAGVCDPATGVCANPVAPDGTACSDGNACTQTDTCVAGACTGTNPVACVASDACHAAGACDPATGACSNPPKPEGTACDDGNANTFGDVCAAGVCAGVDHCVGVTCAALDACHVAGTCDHATGLCSNPAKPNGTACDDGNACTLYDVCIAGACKSSMNVNCPAADACHEAGVCNPSTGLCAVAAKPDGTACIDASACTTGDSCHAGVCSGTPTVCPAADACHFAGMCNPSTGQCVVMPKANGTACDDGNLCTTGDACVAGACTGIPRTCTALDPCHENGTCDPGTGACSNPVSVNGKPCNDLDACTQTDVCVAGACTGSNPVTCAAPDACHVAGSCDHATGVCSNPAAPNGTACSDGNACTQADSCQGGTCTGSNPVACAAADACHDAGSCDAQTGACSNPAKPNGAACDDGNACTSGDACQAGACTGGNSIACAAQDACHVAGSCDPQTGACSNPAAPNGAPCDDGNACTQGDACQGGACTGGSPIACAAADACHDAGTCDPATGVCVNVAKPDGTACDDGNACTTGEHCQAGACGAALSLAIDDGNPCTVDACDPLLGATHVAAADGASCADGDVCNGAETCHAGGCVAGTPLVVDDGDAATFDSCDRVAGVQHLVVAPLDTSVASTIAEQARTYYAGSAPAQTRLDGTAFPLEPKPFDDLRVAILHGVARARGGAPLGGVRVTVWAAPGGPDAAIGQTVSRADGAYDLVLAGGREVTVMLEKPGYFAAHRLVAVPVRDHVHAPDVILLAPDATVTELEQGAGAMQVAEGSVEQDADGARRGVVMVPAGTTMSVSDGHGGLTPLLGPVHLRVTEFTVGAEGPAAMPGTLPPSVAYTYAVEVVSAHSPLQRAARADLQRPAASCSSRSASSR